MFGFNLVVKNSYSLRPCCVSNSEPPLILLFWIVRRTVPLSCLLVKQQELMSDTDERFTQQWVVVVVVTWAVIIWFTADVICDDQSQKWSSQQRHTHDHFWKYPLFIPMIDIYYVAVRADQSLPNFFRLYLPSIAVAIKFRFSIPCYPIRPRLPPWRSVPTFVFISVADSFALKGDVDHFPSK